MNLPHRSSPVITAPEESPQSAPTPAVASRFDRRLISPMILGSIMNPINSSVLSVSLVPIGKAFGAPTYQTAWLVSALYLATAIGQPVVGRLVDLFGPKRLFLIGAVLTGGAGLLGTLAPNLAVLVLARVILGFGTCAGYPASMLLIRAEAKRTGLASPSGVLTLLSVATQIISVIGPSLGGLLIFIGGWRATFAINIPLALASFVIAAIFVPARTVLDQKRGADEHPLASLDYLGIGLFATMLVTLLLFLMTPRWQDTYLVAITVAAAAALTAWERRHPDPFLDLRLLAGNLPLLATYARTLLAMTVSYAYLYGLPQWMEDGRGLSAAQAGLLLMPTALVAITVAAMTGRRREIRGKLVVGAASQIIGCALFLALGGQVGIWLILLITVTFGFPQGLNNLANQNAMYYQADAARIGSSSGLLRTFGYLGAMIASAATGASYGATADTAGLHHLALFMIVIAGLFLALTLADRSLGRIVRPAE